LLILPRFYSLGERRPKRRGIGYHEAMSGHRQEVVRQEPLGLTHLAVDARAILAAQVANMPVTVSEFELAMP
jgi:hypothetical protein